MDVLERSVRVTNSCYNRGLQFVKQRDLSGAMPYLERIPEFNKGLTDARSLPGLIFYGMGEVDDVPVQWIIDIGLRTEDSHAVFYLDDVKRRDGQLAPLSKMVERYNVALEATKNGNYDTAIHQFAGIATQHPNYVRAGLLLSFLCTGAGDYKWTDHYLKPVRKTDRMNQTAVRYADIAERERRRIQKKQDKPREEIDNDPRIYSHREMSDDKVLVPSTYRESMGQQAGLSTAIGPLIGVAAVIFLYMPAKQTELNSSHNAELREIDRELTSANSMLRDVKVNHNSVEEGKNALQSQVNMLIEGEDSKLSQYQKLAGTLNDFRDNNYAHATGFYAILDVSQLTDIDDGNDVSVQQTYRSIAGKTNSKRYLSLYNRAEMQLQVSNYRVTIDLYDKSLVVNQNYESVLFRKAMAYKVPGDMENTNTFFAEVVSRLPSTELVRRVESGKTQ